MAVAEFHNLIFSSLFPSKKDGEAIVAPNYRKLSYAWISVGTTKFQTLALSWERINQ